MAEAVDKRGWKSSYGAAELPRGAGEFAVNSLPSLGISENHVVSVRDR